MENVRVEIFGQVYTLKGRDDAAYIRELAAYVDAKMKEVQQGTGTTDSHRVAILTALTISDELYRLREQKGMLETAAEAFVRRLLDLTRGENELS